MISLALQKTAHVLMLGRGMDNGADYRLARIEQKLDKIQEVLVSMARIEERQAQFEDVTKIILERLEKHSDRVAALEKKVTDNSIWTNALSKGGWLFVAALIGAIVKGWVNL